LQEERRHVVKVWEVLRLVGVVRAQDSVQKTEHSDPNEHENCKVDAICESSAYKLHQKSKLAIGLHELENLESDIQDEDAVTEQEVRIDEINLVRSSWKHIFWIDDPHKRVNWET
tara:strand:+ start:417 stop:761 length:345 start_codon:yes stop_codon:yes gene_type:complete